MSQTVKSSIRQQMLAMRAGMDKGLLLENSLTIRSFLEPCLKKYEKNTVAVYYPLPHEINLLQLVADNPGTAFCLPCTLRGSRHLVFRLFAPETCLVKGLHGIMQPGQEMSECVPDILIVPSVAFDSNRYRIGYGGGYYDTTIKDLRTKKKIITVGVAFSFQEVKAISWEPHDEKLDMVITEKGIL